MEFEETPAINRILSGFVFTLPLLVVLFVFLKAIKPLEHNLAGYWAYYAFISGLIILLLSVAYDALHYRSFVVAKGVVQEKEQWLFVFRFQKQYLVDEIEKIAVEFRMTRPLFAPAYRVQLKARSGHVETLKSFRDEKDADEFCAQISRIVSNF
jgi:hypothetical protein